MLIKLNLIHVNWNHFHMTKKYEHFTSTKY